MHIGIGWFIFWLFVAALFGAQITSHEERVLNYNLEDTELDLFKSTVERLGGEERRVASKLLSNARLVSGWAKKEFGVVKSFFRRILLWRK